MQGRGRSDDFYHYFLSNYSDLLTDSGLVILLDVTINPKHTNYLPQLMNEQISRFVRKHKDVVATLTPVPCHLHEAHCSEACFTQKEFSVSHRLIGNDKSRVAYRVLARAAYAQAFHKNTNFEAEYVICAKPAKNTFKICPHSSGRGAPVDGYKIST